MFESRGSISLITRIWAATLRVLSAGHKGFYSFANVVPSLPVPPLEDTIERYLTSMKALLTVKEFSELQVILFLIKAIFDQNYNFKKNIYFDQKLERYENLELTESTFSLSNIIFLAKCNGLSRLGWTGSSIGPDQKIMDFG